MFNEVKDTPTQSKYKSRNILTNFKPQEETISYNHDKKMIIIISKEEQKKGWTQSFSSQKFLTSVKQNFFNKKAAKQNLKTIFSCHYFWVFVCGLVLNSFIFRDLLMTWADIFSGEATIGAEELVPIFNFQSQYLDQQSNPFSGLTGNFEFRVRYSILTTWTRYYSILPGTLIILNSLTILIIYIGIYRIIRLISKIQSEETWFPILVASAFAGSLLSYFILLYSKITHFYTLIFGFGLFTLAVCLLIEGQIRFNELTRVKKIILLLGLVLLNLFNPATHYVILFILVATALIILEFSKSFIRFLNGANIKSLDWVNMAWLCLIAIFTALSYLAYYYFYVTSENSFSVGDYVSLTRRIITNSSSSLDQILSLGTGAILDFHNFGDYQINPGNRIISAIYSVFLLIAGVVTVVRARSKKDFRIFSIWSFLIALWATSIFFALGYDNNISAHNLASSIVGQIYQLNTPISNFIFAGISTFFQILRFPHRFLFVFQLVNSIGLSIWCLYFLQWLTKKMEIQFKSLRWLVVLLTFIAVLIPYLSGNQIGSTLFSGNFNGFLSPYYYSKDLKDIRSYLQNNPGGQMVILPSTEIPLRQSKDDLGNTFKLIDKFFIYYLDYPTQYYGLGTDSNYKNFFFTIYNQINSDKPWFNLLKNQGIEYILVNKTQQLKDGYSFRNGLEPKILASVKQLSDEGLITTVVDGKDFSLVRLKEKDVGIKTTYYFNESWQDLQEIAFRDNTGFDNYTLADISKKVCDENSFVIQTDLDKSIKDIDSMCNKNVIQYNSQVLPFKSEIESSDDYSTTVFGLFTTTESPLSNKFNTLNSINPGTFNSLNKKITYLLDEGVKVNVPFETDADGNWNIDIRAKLINSNVVASILKDDGSEVKSVKLNLKDSKNSFDPKGASILNNFKYFNLINNLSLTKGKYILAFSKYGPNPIAIDNFLPYTENQINSVNNIYDIEILNYNIYKFTKKS